jgi:hypothetical protein
VFGSAAAETSATVRPATLDCATIARVGDRPPCYRRVVADDPVQGRVYEVLCPHCSKSFRKELLTGPAERYHGFKCPHCRLFVPFERVAEQEGVEPAV